MAGTVIQYKCGGGVNAPQRPTQEEFDERVANKFALVLVPSIDMNLPGQGGPSSGGWFDQIERGNKLKCQYSLLGRSGSVDQLRREKILDGKVNQQSSLEQLKYILWNHLLDAMAFNFTQRVRNETTGKQQIVKKTEVHLPTSMFIIAHGAPRGFVKIGEESIHIFDLLTRIRNSWVGNDYLTEGKRHPLQHVHFESCSALQGVSTEDKKGYRHGVIKDMVITGFDKDIGGGSGGVDVAQSFGAKWMRALSEAAEETRPALWAADELSESTRARSDGVFARARERLRQSVGQAPRGAPTGESEKTMLPAFKII